MKKIYNYILLSVWALASVCCSDDELVESKPSAKPGEEVQFGLSLANSSRTIYGLEANNAFPVYWTNGDLVKIASPQCSFKNAEYKVEVAKTNQNYADALSKTGAAGVQWGSDDAYFYSVYPSTNATLDVSDADNVTATLNIASTQNVTNVLSSNVYYASEMNNENVIMYAKTGKITNGSTVDLQYIPYSTILEVEVNVNPIIDNASILIDALTLTAPSGTTISGNFKLDMSDLSVSAAGNNSNVVGLSFLTSPELDKTNKTLKAKLALIPLNTVENLDGWVISVVARYYDSSQGKLVSGTYTKTLSTAEGTSTALEPGLVHKIKLPAIDAANGWTYDPSKWMTLLSDYKNIYLTELSIPGAWYAGGKGYQEDNHTISGLWQKGIRAFAIECRSWSEISSGYTPSRLAVSGTGRDNLGDGYGDPFLGSCTMISSIISSVSSAVSDTDEFGVLILNYADGGDGGHRDSDYEFFLKGIQTEITKSGATNIITSISPSTTVNQVLNNVIIIANVDARVNYETSGVNALFCSAPLSNEKDSLDNNVLSSDSIYFSKAVPMNWTTSNYEFSATPTFSSNQLYWGFSTANRTQLDTGTDTDLPTYKQRKAALDNMMVHSFEIYNQSVHNVWFYFNAGGTQASSFTDENTSATSFATVMNPHLLELIQNKTNGYVKDNISYSADPSPLGIVMYNFSTGTTYHGDEITQALIEMNNKFTLKRAPSTTAASYDATATSGGNVISLD